MERLDTPKYRRRRRIVVIGFLVFFGGVFLSVFFMTLIETPYNPNYVGWKMGVFPYDESTSVRFLNLDGKFRKSLRGKTKEEVQKWFPDLRTLAEANDYQRYYTKHLQKIEFLWIGGSNWGIEFHEGKVKEFHLVKG